MAPLTRPRGVPILVDAAAEILTIPNVHLQNGATLVGYSGGKCLRGPQTAGLLLGRKDLVKAAWVHSAPHHGFARAMKVGKEEAIGMLAAVEQWVRRDHDAEWRQWTAWLEEIAQRVKTVDGIGLATEITQPAGLSNRTPSLKISWDRKALATSGETVAQTLFQSEPRISLFPARGDREDRTGVTITPYMMAPGDAAVIADSLACRAVEPSVERRRRRRAGLASRRRDGHLGRAGRVCRVAVHPHAAPAPAWQYNRWQPPGRLHQPRPDRHHRRHGGVRPVVLRRRARRRLNYRFTGTIDGDTMTGSLDMGEYLKATWSATRRERSSRR